MSLKSFHIVFVSLSSLLAFVFAGWCLHFHNEAGDTTYFVLSILSAIFGVGLIVYGFWFWRKIRSQEKEEEDDRRRRKVLHTVPVVLTVMWLSQRTADACSVCYGDAEGPMIDAARMGVYLLFGLVLAMQVSFAAFFIRIWRRSRKMQHEAEAPQASDF